MTESSCLESANDLKNRTNKECAKLMNRPQLITRPPIQRKNCWSGKENSDFIDTVVRNWRCSPIYILEQIDEEQDEDEDDVLIHHVFDGAHKIEAVIKFMNDEFALEKIPKLSPLKDFDGKKFSELPVGVRSKIRNYHFTINYVDSDTANDKDALKVLWERLNKAGKKLNDYELALPVIHDLVNVVLLPCLPLFLSSEIFVKDTSKRGEAEKILQLILATSETSIDETIYIKDFSSKTNLVKRWQDSRLGNLISDIKQNTEENSEKWIQNLKKASSYMKCLSENNCFIKEETGVCILQAAHRGTELPFLLGRLVYHFPKPEEFRRICPLLAKEVKEKYLITIIRNEAGRNGALQKRILREIDETVKKYTDMKTPRLFSKEMIEQKLTEQNSTCPLCNEKILFHQTYQGDHIVKYANGGETKYENLQVTHARCNQLK